MMKVAIQGVHACFHDVAARQFFGKTEIVECRTFKELCEAVKEKKADVAIMAIENTIAGSILTNYSLLERYRFKIFGETYLRIELNLMALPGRKIGDLKFAQSHPMALAQCEEFLHQHPHLKAVESIDTAESAREIAQKNLKEHGAIAPRLAAETYGLEILDAGIETSKLNYTRFLAIRAHDDYETAADADKASVRFETPNKPGSLVHVLEAFKENGINMTKIQSVPILGKPYQYSIHADLEWEKSGDYIRALKELEKRAVNLLHFGEYKRGTRP